MGSRYNQSYQLSATSFQPCAAGRSGLADVGRPSVFRRSGGGLLAVMLLVCGPAPAPAGAVPRPKAPVADHAGVVPAPIAQRMNAYLRELEQKTTAQLWVVTVDTTGGVEITDFALGLAEEWKIGQKGKDNGVLIVVAVADRKYRIEVGYGLEGILPDAYCDNVARAYFAPYFRQGRYGEGLYLATQEITNAIAKKHGVQIAGLAAPQLARTPADSRRHMRRATGGLCTAVFPILMLVLVFSSMRRRRGLSGWAFPLLLGMSMGGLGGRRSSWGGGGFSGFGGGGFGGFGGGGSFGGGGASGGW